MSAPRPASLRAATDLALIDLARSDAPEAALAAEELILRQVDRVYAVCLSIVRDPDTADELSQEALLRLFRSLHRYRGDCAWSTWSYRIARNLSLNWRAKMREEVGADGDAVAEPRGTPLDQATDRERAIGVRAALEEALDEEEREAVLLHYAAGLSMKEITDEMGLSNRSGARGVLQRARRKLRRAFADTMPEDSVVIRALGEPEPAPKAVREKAERTLMELTRAPGREAGAEPELRTMRQRQSLID